MNDSWAKWQAAAAVKSFSSKSKNVCVWLCPIRVVGAKWCDWARPTCSRTGGRSAGRTIDVGNPWGSWSTWRANPSCQGRPARPAVARRWWWRRVQAPTPAPSRPPSSRCGAVVTAVDSSAPRKWEYGGRGENKTCCNADVHTHAQCLRMNLRGWDERRRPHLMASQITTLTNYVQLVFTTVTRVTRLPFWQRHRNTAQWNSWRFHSTNMNLAQWKTLK